MRRLNVRFNSKSESLFFCLNKAQVIFPPLSSELLLCLKESQYGEAGMCFQIHTLLFLSSTQPISKAHRGGGGVW